MITGLDHNGAPVLYMVIHFALVEPVIDPKVLIHTGPAVRQALWALGERRFHLLCCVFHANQQVLASEE